MTLVFFGFERFQVSETAIKQTQNLKLMQEMQSTGQLTPQSILDVSKCARERKDAFLNNSIFFFLLHLLSFFIHVPSGHNVALKSSIHTPNNSLFPGI